MRAGPCREGAPRADRGTTPLVDYGPAAGRGHGHVVAAVELDPRGDRVAHARELFECELDRLHHQGALADAGAGASVKAAARRHAAGLWLRRCFYKAGLQPVSALPLHVGPRGTGEISDAEAWNRRCYNDALRALGPRLAAIAQAVACFDHRPSPRQAAELRAALDRLAGWRGL